MKSMILTTAVLAALAMAAAAPAPAKAAPEKKPETQKAKASAKVQATPSQDRPKPAERRADWKEWNKKRAAYKAVGLKLREDLLRRQRGERGWALVIPSSKGKPSNLAEIVEDMNVMSRILDKKLDLAGPKQSAFLLSQLYGAQGVLSVTGATECIYLQGYGALFVITMAVAAGNL